jgi:tRNA(Ile)-lysidine synthase
LLEEILSGGVAEALARTATSLQEDNEVLDGLAAEAHARARSGDGLAVATLDELPAAIRRRVIRLWLLSSGARNLTAKHIRGVDALVGHWHGQGGVAVPTGLREQRLFAGRRDGLLTLHREPV